MSVLTKLKLLAAMVFSRDLETSREAEINLFGGGMTTPTPPKPPQQPDNTAKGQTDEILS